MTMSNLLNYCKNAKYVIIYGITASIFPVPLFKRGVSHIETIKIDNPTKAIDSLHEYGYRADSWIRKRYAHEIHIIKREVYNTLPAIKPYTKKEKYIEITQAKGRMALLIIDMVNDFLHPRGQLFCGKEARQIIPFVKKIISLIKRKGGLILFLRDCHETGDKEFENYSPHCIRDSWGYKIIEELLTSPIDYVIDKSTPNGCLETPLIEILEKERIKNIFIVGVSTSICVMDTATALKYRGYNVSILRKGVADSSKKFHRFALTRMKMLGIQVI